jgi:hypothetical protein
MVIEKITLDTEKVAIKYKNFDTEYSVKKPGTPGDDLVNTWKKLVDIFCNKFDYSSYTKVMPTEIIFKNKDEGDQVKVSIKLSIFEEYDREYKIQTPEYQYVGGSVNHVDNTTNELQRDKHENRHTYLNSQEIEDVNNIIEEAEKFLKSDIQKYQFGMFDTIDNIEVELKNVG